MIRPLQADALKMFRAVSNTRRPLVCKQSMSNINGINFALV